MEQEKIIKEEAKNLINKYATILDNSMEDFITPSDLIKASKEVALTAVDDKISTYRLLFPLIGLNCEFEDSNYYKELIQVKEYIKFYF